MGKNENAERLNPCLKEQEQSYHCLNKNNFDQDKCGLYFDNYNVCKKFWTSMERRYCTGGRWDLHTAQNWLPIDANGMHWRRPSYKNGHSNIYIGKVYSDRKAKGIYPYLPNVDERAKIKEDYMKSVRAALN